MKAIGLKTVSNLLQFVLSILRHPLNRGQPIKTAGRYLAWQIGSRLLRQPVLHPFANDLRMLVATGFWGATGVVYFGLEEYEDMAFCTHLLRPDDTFVDVGACYGTYTLLAAGVAGARTVTFEPNPATARWLNDNVRLNRLEARVEIHQCAVGAAEGHVRMTGHLRAANHVVAADETASGVTVSLPVTRLDTALANRQPTLIKIDVEGYEQDVLDGATMSLKSESLIGLIVEDAGLRRRYHSTSDIHASLLALGFRSFRYVPERRELIDLHGQPNRASLNTLYLRNLPLIQQRLSTAPAFTIRGHSI